MKFFVAIGMCMVILAGCYQIEYIGNATEGEKIIETVDETYTEEEMNATVDGFFATFDDEVCADESDHEQFTGPDAVSMALEKYGVDDDIVYLYDAEPIHYGGGIGYYVALKSMLLAAEGGDGIVMTLFVSDDGRIYEQ
ncbi:MAG: hypothetical protein ACRCST_14605 [Turicibacter sp.]